MLKIGVTLPQFRDEADSALATAREAERLGIDGVFCFDHLWPIGRPGSPALSAAPLLGALAAATSTIAIGTLVARVGLVPDATLVAMLASLSAMSGGRFIASVGTGATRVPARITGTTNDPLKRSVPMVAVTNTSASAA